MLKNIVKLIKILLVVGGIEAALSSTTEMIKESNSKNKHLIAVVCGSLIGILGAKAINKIK